MTGPELAAVAFGGFVAVNVVVVPLIARWMRRVSRRYPTPKE